MKRILFFMLSLLFISGLLLHNGIAQSYTRWELPNGAASRLGKGSISTTGNISYSPDGSKLAVGSSQGVWIYDARIGTEIRLLSGHKGPVHALAFSPDGKTLASGANNDEAIRLWDVETGILKTTFEVHQSTMFLEFSSNGRTLVSDSWSDPIRLWDITTGQYKTLTIFESNKYWRIHKVAFSPDGTILAGSVPSFYEIRFWDSLTGEHKSTIFGVGDVTDLAFSPDGKTIANASQGNDRNEYPIKLWDIATGKLKLILEGHLKYTASIEFSPDGETLASGSDNGMIAFWNTTTGRKKLDFEAHENSVISVAYSPYGGTLASVGWDHGWDQFIRFWNAETGHHKLIISGHTDNVYSVSFSLDGKTLASGSGLGFIRFWNIEKARLEQTLYGFGHRVKVSYSPDGEILASVSARDGKTRRSIKLWDADTKQPKHELSLGPEPWRYMPGGYVSLTFSPDGNSIAAGLSVLYEPLGTFNGELWVWDVATGEFKFSAGQERFGNPPNGRDLNFIGFSPDGKRIVVGSKVYNSTSGSWEKTLKTRVNAIAFSPDGQTLAVGTRTNRIDGGKLQLWNFRRGVHETDLLGYEHPIGNPYIATLMYSPDGKTLASGSNEDIRLYDIETGEERQILKGHTDVVQSIDYSPDGSLLASGGRDGTILIWDSIDEFYEEEEEEVVTPIYVEDVNLDGVIDIADLVLVAKQFGQFSEDRADVNGDKVVDIVDLLLVAEAFGSTAAAPSVTPQVLEILTAAEVQQWLTDAKSLGVNDARMARGIVVLEQLLVTLMEVQAIPAKTALLPNYPNPFNPETWIPYHLAHDADVTLTIYDTKGVLVRQLDLGHQRAGFYTDREKAVHWDGRNDRGELVASGVYAYQFRAGDYVALRRMVILK